MRPIAIASLVLSVSVFGFVACSSSTPPGAPPANDAGAPDSGDASIPPATDSSTPGSDAAEDGGMDSSAPPDALAGPFVAVTSIPLAGGPSALAFNPVMNSLYVALTGIGAPGTGSGIAVIDSATNTVAATIPYPGDASAPFPIVQMAVDYISNTLYAADSNFRSSDGGGGQTLYVIDGVTNAVVTTIPIVSDLGMQVDSTAHKIYVLGAAAPGVPDGGTNAVSPPTITILDGTTNDAGAPIVVLDQAIFSGSAIALDPIVRQLYLCGPNATQYSTETTNLAAIDTFDTANGLAPVGAQQAYAGARRSPASRAGAVARSSPPASPRSTSRASRQSRFQALRPRRRSGAGAPCRRRPTSSSSARARRARSKLPP